MFKSFRERLSGWKEKAEAEVTTEAIGDSGRKIKEDKLEEILYDLEIALLESDVAFPIAKEIVDRLADDLKGKRVSRDVTLAMGVEAALRDAITHALSVPPVDFFQLIEKCPRPRPRRRPDRHRRPDADEPEPDGPDEEDQTRGPAEPHPVHRRRARGERRDRAGEAVPRSRRHRRDRPDEDRCGRQRRRRPVDGEDDRQAGRVREPRADLRRHPEVRREVDGRPPPRGGLT